MPRVELRSIRSQADRQRLLLSAAGGIGTDHCQLGRIEHDQFARPRSPLINGKQQNKHGNLDKAEGNNWPGAQQPEAKRNRGTQHQAMQQRTETPLGVRLRWGTIKASNAGASGE